MDNEPLMTIKEVAEYLRVTPATIYRLMKSGEIASIKFSAKKFTRIKSSDVSAFVERHTKRRRPRS